MVATVQLRPPNSSNALAGYKHHLFSEGSRPLACSPSKYSPYDLIKHETLEVTCKSCLQIQEART